MALTATLAPVPHLQQPLSREALLSLTEELASAVAGTDLNIPPGEQRAFVRLTVTQSCEAWLIAWKPGSALGMHDHGGSAAAIAVASGTLAEAYLDRGQPGHAGVDSTQARSSRCRRIASTESGTPDRAAPSACTCIRRRSPR